MPTPGSSTSVCATLDYLLEAARRLPEHLFVFTGGQPPVIRQLEAELRARGVRNTHFTGLLARPEDVRYYQQAADVLVSCYSIADHATAHHNLPNKITEYMTTGNPIVATDFPAVRDLLTDKNSILIEPESIDALVRGIRQAERAVERAAQARDDVATQTCESVALRLTALPVATKKDAKTLSRPLRARNPASLISNEIIALELIDCLERHFGSRTGGTLLDVGAGTKPYAPIYGSYFATCTSVDVDHSPHDIGSVDTIASAEHLPFEDGSFDCVVCTEVLEHCRRPGQVMAEIARVLRPGGWVFLTTPFLRPLHEMPHDYFRFTPSALAHLAEEAGLSVERILPRGDYLALSLLTLQLPLTKVLQRLSRAVGGRLYQYSNPLVYATVVAPQLGYLALWRVARRNPRGVVARVHKKLSYYALGYVSTFRGD